MASVAETSSLVRRVRELSTEADDLEARLSELVRRAAPHTLTLPGVGTIHTAQMLTTAGQNIDRSEPRAPAHTSARPRQSPHPHLSA